MIRRLVGPIRNALFDRSMTDMMTNRSIDPAVTLPRPCDAVAMDIRTN
jgi:hypothetical protein